MKIAFAEIYDSGIPMIPTIVRTFEDKSTFQDLPVVVLDIKETSLSQDNLPTVALFIFEQLKFESRPVLLKHLISVESGKTQFDVRPVEDEEDCVGGSYQIEYLGDALGLPVIVFRDSGGHGTAEIKTVETATGIYEANGSASATSLRRTYRLEPAPADTPVTDAMRSIAAIHLIAARLDELDKQKGYKPFGLVRPAGVVVNPL